jgi:hypothetical protein
MEGELVHYFEEGEEILPKSMFISRDELLEIWKGYMAYIKKYKRM